MRFTVIVNYTTKIDVKPFLDLFWLGPTLLFFAPNITAYVPFDLHAQMTLDRWLLKVYSSTRI